MSNTVDEEVELVELWIRNLATCDLIELWENLTEEVNNPSLIWGMDFFLEDYLPERISSKDMDVIELARIITANDGCVKHFDINDDYVYINSFGLWESVKEYDIADLVIEFINDHDCLEYSDIIKAKLAEIKEDASKE